MGLGAMAAGWVARLFEAGIDDTISDLRRKNKKQADEIKRLNRTVKMYREEKEKARAVHAKNEEKYRDMIDERDASQRLLDLALQDIAELKARDIGGELAREPDPDPYVDRPRYLTDTDTDTELGSAVKIENCDVCGQKLPTVKGACGQCSVN
jgi:hypothetical protein